MIFKFKNSFVEPIDFILEPSADLITLSNQDLLEIAFDGDCIHAPFDFSFIEKGCVLWIPQETLIKVYLNGVKIDTLYENFDW